MLYLSMNNPITIANYFIKKSFDTGIPLTPMKLVKLVYLAHGWNLAIKDEALINEAVQAWKYGPVIPSVYQSVKHFGTQPISSMVNILKSEPIKEDTMPLLDKVWSIYEKHNGLNLSTITHQKDSPWDKTWNQNGGKEELFTIIPNDSIKEYYKNIIANNKRVQ
jgi:uncharacterized phage-associated protein